VIKSMVILRAEDSTIARNCEPLRRSWLRTKLGRNMISSCLLSLDGRGRLPVQPLAGCSAVSGTAKIAHRMFKKAPVLTRPTPARQDAPLRGRGRSHVHGARNNAVRDATKKERHVCARARDGERPVSRNFLWTPPSGERAVSCEPAVLDGEVYSFLPARPEPAETGSFPGP
jgi:hypothetical protein